MVSYYTNNTFQSPKNPSPIAKRYQSKKSRQISYPFLSLPKTPIMHYHYVVYSFVTILPLPFQRLLKSQVKTWAKHPPLSPTESTTPRTAYVAPERNLGVPPAPPIRALSDSYPRTFHQIRDSDPRGKRSSACCRSRSR